MQARVNRRVGRIFLPKICIFFVLAFMATTLAGCVSMEDLEGGIPQPTPTPGQQQGEPAESAVEIRASEIITSNMPVGGGYVEKPYGYLWFEERIIPSVVVIDVKAETDITGRRYITGRIRNEGKDRIDHLTVVYNVLDANGNVLRNACASINYLGAGKTWKFSTDPFEAKDYQYFELAEIFAV